MCAHPLSSSLTLARGLRLLVPTILTRFWSKKRRDKQQFFAPPTHSPAPTASFPLVSLPFCLRTGSTPHNMLHIQCPPVLSRGLRDL
ncbi:hypothetical protein BJV77DRAFT_409820 [Russula vinacea]|nr:hypothetical protein BJV77DRAFT_409820 [Russula vinacea]